MGVTRVTTVRAKIFKPITATDYVERYKRKYYGSTTLLSSIMRDTFIRYYIRTAVSVYMSMRNKVV